MKTCSLNAYSAATRKNIKNNSSLKGYILNTRVQNPIQNQNFDNFNFSDFQKPTENKEENNFDEKKALKPLLIGTGAIFALIGGISACIGAYSKNMAKAASVVRPPDLARNINIVEEPHFAMYRALRDPNAKNILGLVGVGVMSGVTLCAKNFVDGAKEIWIKKQNNDIQYDLEKNLIDVETSAFRGKLNVVDELFNKANKIFDKKSDSPISFRGNEKNEEKTPKKEQNKKALFYGALGVGAFVGISFLMFKNYQKIVKNLDIFKQKTTDIEIKNKIQSSISLSDKKEAIENLTGILKSTNAPDSKIRENFEKIKGITKEEIDCALKKIKEAQIYVQAPEALGGVSEKIQYYCYINEDRGHLYNWILNPENKFNKYVFLAFSSISAIGYLTKAAVDAVKEVTVQKESTKNELNLKKRLVEVEIANFEAKKESAIEPLIENYNEEKKKGKSKEELDEIAQNVLFEIKNGPPYVYD